jgi:hypothetical protein
MNWRFDDLPRVCCCAKQTKSPMAGKKNFPEPTCWNDRPPDRFSFFVVGRIFKDKKLKRQIALRIAGTHDPNWVPYILSNCEFQFNFVFIYHQ